MEIISKYKFSKSSTKKLKLILNTIKKYKNIKDVVNLLNFTNKKTASFINKTIKSAISNAKNNFNLNIDDVKIKKILLNNGPSFKKVFPRAKGRVNYIKKRTTHIIVELEKI